MTDKIKAARIWLNRAEGPVRHCGERTITTGNIWDQANSQLYAWSWTAPRDGSYDKVDFKVTYDDGFEYSGRIDITYREYRLDLHIREVNEFYASDEERAVLARKFAEMEKEPFERFLEMYEIGRAA